MDAFIAIVYIAVSGRTIFSLGLENGRTDGNTTKIYIFPVLCHFLYKNKVCPQSRKSSPLTSTQVFVLGEVNPIAVAVGCVSAHISLNGRRKSKPGYRNRWPFLELFLWVQQYLGLLHEVLYFEVPGMCLNALVVCSGLLVSNVWSAVSAEHQPDMVAGPASGQLKRETYFSLSPFAPDNLVSRDGFGRPALRQPAHSPHSG